MPRSRNSPDFKDFFSYFAAVVTEYLIRYCELIFNSSTVESSDNVVMSAAIAVSSQQLRPKSLAISTPTKLLSLEEARSKHGGPQLLNATLPAGCQKFIDVGGGPDKLPAKYHTVIDLPSVKKAGNSSSSSSASATSSNSGKEHHVKTATKPAWKSIFNGSHGTSNKKLLGQDKLALPPELEEEVKKAKVRNKSHANFEKADLPVT